MNKLCWLLASAGVGVVHSMGAITFYAKPQFQGAQTRVFAPAEDTCVDLLTCIKHPVHSISWTDIVLDNTFVTNVSDLKGRVIKVFDQPDCTGNLFALSVQQTSCPIKPTTFSDQPASFFVPSPWSNMNMLAATLHGLQGSLDTICHAVDPDAEAARTADFNGSVTFHQLPYRGGKTATIALSSSQRCYTFNLPDEFNGGSMSWRDLPTWSSLNTEQTSRLILYSDSDCQTIVGNVDTTSPDETKSRHQVRSLMFQQYSPFVLKNATTARVVLDESVVGVPTFNASMRFQFDGNHTVEHQFDKVETCYNVGCVQTNTTSATWSGVPTRGRMFSNASAIAFFDGEDCRELKEVVRVEEEEEEEEGPRDFAVVLVKKSYVSMAAEARWSFMVWVNRQTSTLPAVNDQCLLKAAVSQPSPSPAVRSGHVAGSWLWPTTGTLLLALSIAASVFTFIRKRNLFCLNKSLYMGLASDETLRNIRVAAEDIVIEGALFSTAQAIVYAGTFQAHSVTVKKLLPELRKHAEAREAIVSEAKMIAPLDHPKILRVIGVFWTLHGDLGIVYEPIDGTDLETFLHEHREELSWTAPGWKYTTFLPSKLQIALDVAEALVLLHSYEPPILNGNSWTRSVMVSASGRAKMWNLQPLLSGTSCDFHGSSCKELIQPTASSDIRAFGVLLRAMGADRIESTELTDGTHTSSQSIGLDPSCPVEVTDLCRRCLTHECAERLSAVQVFHELKQLEVRLHLRSDT